MNPLRCGFITGYGTLSWPKKITNEEIMRRMGTCREIVRQFKTRTLQYIGDVTRHDTTIKLIKGKIDSRRSLGRPRTTWTTDMANSTGAKYYQLKRAAEDAKQKAWSDSQHDIAQEMTIQ